MTLEDIGEGDDGLLCTTNFTACRLPPYTGDNASVLGNWYFPNGTRVLSSGTHEDFYITRGQMVVALNRIRGGVEGIYCCEIPGSMNVTQILLIPISWRLQVVRRQYSKKRQILPFNCQSNDPGPCSAALPSAQSSYRDENWPSIPGVLGHRIHAKISPKAASEKAQTTVSGNRYTNPIIDVFRTVVSSLLASTGNSVQALFLGTPGTTYLRYSLAVSLSVYSVFSPR